MDAPVVVDMLWARGYLTAPSVRVISPTNGAIWSVVVG